VTSIESSAFSGCNGLNPWQNWRAKACQRTHAS